MPFYGITAKNPPLETLFVECTEESYTNLEWHESEQIMTECSFLRIATAGN